MTQLLGLLLTTLLTVVGFGGCTHAGGTGVNDPGLPASNVGTSLASWNEGQYPDIQDNPELTGPRVIATQEQRQALLDSQPLGPNLKDVADVDLSESVLVIAGYPACQEQGAVWGDGRVVWFDAAPPAGSEGIACVWSPYTVDIFEVPRRAFGGEFVLVTPPWDAREGPVRS